jgi:hypothetical protein
MPLFAARKTCSLVLFTSVWVGTFCVPISSSKASDSLPAEPEFSGTLTKRVNGKQYRAQVFAKGAWLRVEHTYAIRTELGFAAIEIIRPDVAEIWYVLPQRKELLVAPLTEDVLPVRPELVGETTRTSVGDDEIAGRAARLFDVQVERHGRLERYYEWIDVETGIVLKLVSQDRDWSFEYERVRLSPQPSIYFEEPPGYRKRLSTANQRRVE